MDLLSAVRRLRRDHLDDHGGDSAVADEWITDDSGCRWGNDQLVDFLDTSLAVYLETVGLYDSDAAVGAVTLPLVADQSVYAIPGHVISIERAVLASKSDEGPVLKRMPHRRVEEKAREDMAEILYYQDDLYNRQIRLWGTPTEDHVPDSLVLQVKRMAMNTLFWDGADSSLQSIPVVQPKDHPKILPYAAYLAYSVADEEADVKWPEMANHWLQIHVAQVGPLDSAWLHNWRRRQTANRLHRATPFGL